jgi:UDP-3-O-[3-hydroxymyristoyl] N-acetylglucosamine deacetylase
LPAPFGAGIVFHSKGVEIPAHVDYVTDTSRCTVLGKDGVIVSTVEHLLSALSGNNVWDIVVEINGTELPIGDGSANLWQEALEKAGFAPIFGDFDSHISVFTYPDPVLVSGKSGSFIWARGSTSFRATVATSFDHLLVGTQVSQWAYGLSYAEEVAPARTFGFIEEVEALRKAGLALGGSEENAVVVYPDRYSKPLRFPTNWRGTNC